jgi:hypothetical protein
LQLFQPSWQTFARRTFRRVVACDGSGGETVLGQVPSAPWEDDESAPYAFVHCEADVEPAAQ